MTAHKYLGRNYQQCEPNNLNHNRLTRDKNNDSNTLFREPSVLSLNISFYIVDAASSCYRVFWLATVTHEMADNFDEFQGVRKKVKVVSAEQADFQDNKEFWWLRIMKQMCIGLTASSVNPNNNIASGVISRSNILLKPIVWCCWNLWVSAAEFDTWACQGSGNWVYLANFIWD